MGRNKVCGSKENRQDKNDNIIVWMCKNNCVKVRICRSVANKPKKLLFVVRQKANYNH